MRGIVFSNATIVPSKVESLQDPPESTYGNGGQELTNVHLDSGNVIMVALPREEVAEILGIKTGLHDVWLVKMGERKIQVIKAIREITLCGLKEGKLMSEAAPICVRHNLTEEVAQVYLEKLHTAGAVAEVR